MRALTSRLSGEVCAAIIETLWFDIICGTVPHRLLEAYVNQAASSCTITGAIFDCDGTLVDSMPMWNAIVEDTFDAYGIAKTPELLAEAEAFNFDDMCFWFHDRFGIGESGEAVLAQIRAEVQAHYLNDIELFEGCRAFLDELRNAGVRMLILSATTEPEVRVALRAHGLEDYFERVIQTSETGSDKEHPAAYQYALAKLGTPMDQTWVFEDAPFAVRTAHDMGLKTVCLYNDHDSRDLAFCTQHADILAHGYAELSLARLLDYARPTDASSGVLHALVVDGSPHSSTPDLVARLAQESQYVIAADRGAEVCHSAGVAPNMLCGDADSIDAETLAWARATVGSEVAFPSEKYATDLALAVDCARHEAARRQAELRLTVTCASGGRPDHALAVLGCLGRSADTKPRLVEDDYECRILSPSGLSQWEICAPVGTTVSMIPLTKDAIVSEAGMHWNLSHRSMDLLSDEGVSNVVASEHPVIACHQGLLAVFVLH